MHMQCEMAEDQFSNWLADRKQPIEYWGVINALEEWAWDKGSQSAMDAVGGDYTVFLQTVVIVLAGWSDNHNLYEYRSHENENDRFKKATYNNPIIFDEKWFEVCRAEHPRFGRWRPPPD